MALTLSQIAPKTERFSFGATLRYSLGLAENNDKQLTTRACSSDADAMAATQESLREIAKANKPEAQPDVANWDHSSAEYWLWVTNVDADSSKYDRGQLITAATAIGAELRVFHNFSYTTIQPHILKLVTMANTQVLGFWGGRLLELVSFVATAAKAYGATFDGSSVKRDSWGLRRGAGQTRILEAFRDLRISPSSLRLLAYKIGAWRVRLNGTLTNMRLGWITHFPFQSLRKITPFRSLAENEDFVGSSSSESELPVSPASKKLKNKGLTQQAGE